MFKNYFEVRAWLEEFIPYTYSKKNLGLERVTKLLELLGNPQKKFKSIHVGGTSGKGSTAFYISELLLFSGIQGSTLTRRQGTTLNSFKVGLHVSPHLVDIRERMRVFRKESKSQPVLDRVETRSGRVREPKSQSLMPMERFLRLFNEIKPVVEKIKKEKPDLTPSYFEILVAASFLYFVREKVDFAVVEVGLGGRFDATNVLQPLVTVITNVGLDHTDILGKTIEQIAYEKAGIIKESKSQSVLDRVETRLGRVKGAPVITAARGKALEIIEKVAREKKAPLININTLSTKNGAKSEILRNLKAYFDVLKTSSGPFVLENAMLAIVAVEVLEKGVILRQAQDFVLRGLREAPFGKSFDSESLRLDELRASPFSNLPGRFEEIEKGVILDGAHNLDKVGALIQWIKATFDRKHLTSDQKLKLSTVNCQLSTVLVVAFKKGKDWKRMIDLLMKEFLINTNVKFQIEKVIATEFKAVTDTGKFGVVPAGEIANYLRNVERPTTKVKVIENSQEAVFEALRLHSGSSTLVLVTGSFYLVGEVRTMWELPNF